MLFVTIMIHFLNTDLAIFYKKDLKQNRVLCSFSFPVTLLVESSKLKTVFRIIKFKSKVIMNKFNLEKPKSTKERVLRRVSHSGGFECRSRKD